MRQVSKDQPLHIYRASAGSGKTFLLTTSYLSLLFESPSKYREILAVTFTNKATEEMKRRILQELRQLASDSPSAQREELLKKFPDLAHGNRLALQADLLYRAILHDYAKFSVSTIDSFVQQVIRSFAFEIGLDAGFELEINQDLVKQDLAGRLYDLLETRKDLLAWILRMATERIEAGKPWDFRSEMIDIAGEIFKERFYLFEDNMRRLEDPAACFETMRNKLRETVQDMKLNMQAIASKALSLLQQHDLTIEDFPNKKAGFAAYFQNILRDEKFTPGARAVAAVNEPDKWTTKSTPPEVIERIHAVYPTLNNLLNQAIEQYREKSLAYHTAKAVLPQFSYLNLLKELSDLLADYRRDNNALLISDTQQLLRELVRDNEAPFIYEKIGNRFQHFLLDEFQDTSSFQWDNFRPLIEQSVSTAHFNLIVGDVKQAIYRWRNGDWRLLQSGVKEDIGAYHVHEDSLTNNYRSLKNIIAFNNFLFPAAANLLQEQFNAEMETVEDKAIHERLSSRGYFRVIREAYADAAQTTPTNAKEGGVIDIRFFEKTDSRSPNSWRPGAELWLCELIDSLIADKGIQPSQITLLTRNNKDAKRLISLLLHHQQTSGKDLRYGLVSTDALAVNASPAIQLLLAALRYLVNEKDNLALAELVQANAIRLGLDLSKADWYKTASGHALQQLPEGFHKKIKQLKQSSLYPCLEEIISLFEIDRWISEQPYTLAFRDLANQYSGKGRNDIRDFLAWWEEEGQEKALPMSASVNAVQVLTIHKSKGLAFDIVILPYADWDLAAKKDLLWCTWDDPETAISVVPVKLAKTLAQTTFAYDYFEEMLMSRMDSLNLLYVALTRARQALYILAPRPSEKKEETGSLTQIGDLFRGCLPDSEEDAKGEANRFSFRRTENSFVIEGNLYQDQQNQEVTNTLKLLPAKTIFGTQKDLRDPDKKDLVFRASGNEQQQVGKLVHLALSRISRLSDLDGAIKEMELQGLLPEQHIRKVTEAVQKTLEHPKLSAWFNGNYITHNERTILLKGGAVRRPDKVLVGAEDTILLDFKFTQEVSVTHGKQLKQYQELLEAMDYKKISAYVYYGFNQALISIDQLPAAQGKLFDY